MRKAAALLLVASLTVGAASASRLPGAPACPVFPSPSPWNQRVDRLPAASDSDRIVASIGVGDRMHADFGSGLWAGGPIGIPVTVVRGTQPKARVAFDYADESDRGPYPIPVDVAMRGAAPPTATGTHSSSTATAAGSTSSSHSAPPRAAAGARARARSGICARRGSGLPAGRRPTRRGCRSCPASLATRKSRAAGSTTRSASPPPAHAAPTSGRRATSRATRPIRHCRRWACACV